MAEVSRLTSIPLGRGTATITWTGKGGISPTVTSISGKADGFTVSASDKPPKFPGLGGSATGASAPTSVSIPANIPIADVRGTIDGAPFTLHVVISLPQSLTSGGTGIGRVTGTFKNQRLSATLSAKATSDTVAFKGTIGTVHVSGVIGKNTRHGNTTTAHASFDVTG
jgi:hypothetical protein